MDARDHHVLAAALSVDADILLTENTKHFPRGWMDNRGIELLTAGELLTRLGEQFPDKLRAAHEATVRSSRKAPAEVLATLESSVGEEDAAAVRAALEHPS